MRVGIVGVGFMGWIHYQAYQRSENADLIGFCSRDEPKRSGDWRSIRGNFGPPGEQIDVSDLVVTESLDQLLGYDNIDLVDICLPPHLHVDAVKRSLAAGKYVLCEKPLSLTAKEADELVSIGDGRLMVAHLLPMFPQYDFLVRAASDQRFGKLLGGRFKRVIGPPSWIPDFYDPARVGGPLIDLHVHDAHLIRLLFGMPSSVHSGKRMHVDDDGVSSQVPAYVDTIFHFADASLVVSAVSGVIRQNSRGFTHGYDVQFEKANVQFEFAAFADGSAEQMRMVIAHQDGSVERPTWDAGDDVDAFVKEIDAAATFVAGGAMHDALDPRIAADAIRICEMQM